VRKISHERRAGVLQIHQIEQIRRPLFRGRRIDAVHLRHEVQRFLGRQPIEEGQVFRDDARAAFDRD